MDEKGLGGCWVCVVWVKDEEVKVSRDVFESVKLRKKKKSGRLFNPRKCRQLLMTIFCT